MAISQRAKDLTENIYLCYGSGTGWLFGISPDLRPAVEGIVQSVLDQVEDIGDRVEEKAEAEAEGYIAACPGCEAGAGIGTDHLRECDKYVPF